SDAFGASQALGASLGAGALSRLLTQTPDRFERVVFFLPAALDQVRPLAALASIRALLDAVADGDFGTTAELLSAEIPAVARDSPAAWRYLRERIDALIPDGLAPQLRTLVGQPAVPDPADLAKVTARALVIGCRGDEAHPPAVAQALAA